MECLTRIIPLAVTCNKKKMKIKLLFLTLFFLIIGCKTSKNKLIIPKENTTCLYGVLDQKSIDWFLKKEQEIKSEKSDNKTSFFRRTFEAKSEKFFRTESSKFQPLPIVDYVYDNKTRKTKEIHYEWDKRNHLAQKEKNNVRIETKERSNEFISYFKHLSNYLNENLGENKRNGSLDMDKTLSYEFIEITDKWETEKLSCELYMIFSNHYEKRGIMEIKPTHRIRLKIEYK